MKDVFIPIEQRTVRVGTFQEVNSPATDLKSGDLIYMVFDSPPGMGGRWVYDAKYVGTDADGVIKVNVGLGHVVEIKPDSEVFLLGTPENFPKP